MQIYLTYASVIKATHAGANRSRRRRREWRYGIPGSCAAAARAETGSSTRRSPAPIARFGDVCFVDDDDIWKKRAGPANSR